MKRKILLIIICCLLFTTACNNNFKDKNIKNSTINTNTNKESDKKVSNEKVDNVKVTIKNKTYILKLEDNKTVEEFVKILPRKFKMNELNGNEKYYNMNNPITTNPYNPNHIEKGDVMLYGDNCLVIFYKSFDTSYSYTKIGHIDNLEDLGKENITVKFEI